MAQAEKHSRRKPAPAFFRPLSGRKTGIGARDAHYHEILSTRPDVGWLEVHSENFFAPGGPALSFLDRAREIYPVSLHGVGLSLGSAAGVDDRHLAQVADLVRRVNPVLVSEHVSFSQVKGVHVPDLLPLPMTGEALDVVARNIDTVQAKIKKQILIENPSSYLAFRNAEMEEPAFLAALVEKTGCGLLLDVNNIYVSASHIGFDPRAYIDAVPLHAVQEVHLAGYHVNKVEGRDVLVDAHNNPVCPAVWELYGHLLDRAGDIATLVEWDTDLPALAVLVGEANKADKMRPAALTEAAHG